MRILCTCCKGGSIIDYYDQMKFIDMYFFLYFGSKSTSLSQAWKKASFQCVRVVNKTTNCQTYIIQHTMIGQYESHTPRDTGEKRKTERNGEIEQGLKKKKG